MEPEETPAVQTQSTDDDLFDENGPSPQEMDVPPEQHEPAVVDVPPEEPPSEQPSIYFTLTETLSRPAEFVVKSILPDAIVKYPSNWKISPDTLFFENLVSCIRRTCKHATIVETDYDTDIVMVYSENSLGDTDYPPIAFVGFYKSTAQLRRLPKPVTYVFLHDTVFAFPDARESEDDAKQNKTETEPPKGWFW